jgi:hypothetical protein
MITTPQETGDRHVNAKPGEALTAFQSTRLWFWKVVCLIALVLAIASTMFFVLFLGDSKGFAVMSFTSVIMWFIFGLCMAAKRSVRRKSTPPIQIQQSE